MEIRKGDSDATHNRPHRKEMTNAQYHKFLEAHAKIDWAHSKKDIRENLRNLARQIRAVASNFHVDLRESAGEIDVAIDNWLEANFRPAPVKLTVICVATKRNPTPKKVELTVG
jgi:hypothetical protein